MREDEGEKENERTFYHAHQQSQMSRPHNFRDRGERNGIAGPK